MESRIDLTECDCDTTTWCVSRSDLWIAVSLSSSVEEISREISLEWCEISREWSTSRLIISRMAAALLVDFLYTLLVQAQYLVGIIS
jgi:hypothetical protein